MIERVADFRFQIEKADYEKLCIAAGASPEQCRAGVAAARRAAAAASDAADMASATASIRRIDTATLSRSAAR